MPPVDLNDPTTWDSLSDQDLLKMAESGVTVDGEEPKTEEPKTEEPKAEPTQLRPADAVPENTPVLAADGKNTIPYSVLKEARDAARTAQAETQRLQAELESLRSTQAALTPIQAPVAAPATVAAAPVEIPADVRQRLDKIKEDWGADIADQAERTWRIEQQTLQQQKVIDQLLQQVQTQQHLQQRTEAEQIEDAIAASPKLDVWAKSADPGWFDRSVELHAVLMKTDRQYAAMDWFQRMKALPDKVEALFGPSMQKVDADSVKAKAQEVLGRPPASLSDLSSGIAPEKNEFQRIEELDGNFLQGHINKIASDPRKLETYLRKFA